MRFVATFLASFVLFEIAYYQVVVGSAPFQAYLSGVCQAAAVVLRAAGEPVEVHDVTLSSVFSMTVASGCDGLQPVSVFAIAIAAFPGSPRRKLVGIAAGATGLLGLNVLRVASLFWTGVHAPQAFQLMHVHVWPAILIGCAVMLWARWAMASRPPDRTA